MKLGPRHPSVPEYLYPGEGHDELCRDPKCASMVKQNPATKRYFITMCHAGFNSPANNGNGYKSQDAAVAASLRYLNPRFKITLYRRGSGRARVLRFDTRQDAEKVANQIFATRGVVVGIEYDYSARGK